MASAAVRGTDVRCVQSKSRRQVECERPSCRIAFPLLSSCCCPKDTNPTGTIFGGVILSHIDLASAVEARKAAPCRYVTRAMNQVEFHQPVFVGDVVSFYTETVRVGRTSITVRVSVEAERWSGGLASSAGGLGELVKVTGSRCGAGCRERSWKPRADPA